MPSRSLSTARYRRHARVRAKISGTPTRPRLVVFRSVAHIEAQLVDDLAGRTLAAVSDRNLKAKGTKSERAAAVGTALAKLALEKKLNNVVFDRGGYRFHGRIKALADAARAAGLTF